MMAGVMASLDPRLAPLTRPPAGVAVLDRRVEAGRTRAAGRVGAPISGTPSRSGIHCAQRRHRVAASSRAGHPSQAGEMNADGNGNSGQTQGEGKHSCVEVFLCACMRVC